MSNNIDRLDECIKHTGMYGLWQNETFLSFRVNFVKIFKYCQSSGSTAKLLENAGEHGKIPFLSPGFSTSYAFAGAMVTWITTMYSRGPAIERKMRTIKHVVEQEVYKDSTFIYGLHFIITAMAYTSSICVLLSAYLSGFTLVNLFLMPALSMMLPSSMFAVAALYLPICLAAFTAVSSWYSFYAYSIPRCQDFALTKGKRAYQWWINDAEYQEELRKEAEEQLASEKGINNAFWYTVLFCVPVVAASIFGGFFFVSHALSLIANTFGLSFLTHDLITTIAIVFMFPSLITTISSKCDSVYNFFKGDENWQLLMAVRMNIESYLYGTKLDSQYALNIPNDRNFLVFIGFLAICSVIDLFNSGIGAWISGCSVSRRLAGVDPDTLDGAAKVFSDLVLVVLACSDTLQNMTFTILPMLNEQVKNKQEQVRHQHSHKDSLQAGLVVRKQTGYKAESMLKRNASFNFFIASHMKPASPPAAKDSPLSPTQSFNQYRPVFT